MHIAWFWWILVLALALVFGYICAAIADWRGHSGYGFGILGFFAFLVVFIATYSAILALPSG